MKEEKIWLNYKTFWDTVCFHFGIKSHLFHFLQSQLSTHIYSLNWNNWKVLHWGAVEAPTICTTFSLKETLFAETLQIK